MKKGIILILIGVCWFILAILAAASSQKVNPQSQIAFPLQKGILTA